MSEAPDEVRRKAVELLARREHSRSELFHKLRARGHEAAAVESTLDSLQAEGLLSDERFAEAYVRRRVERGYGPLRIGHELGERGVARDLVRTLLGDTTAQWVARAVRARQRKFGPEAPAGAKERARQSRFLSYRGFTGEQVRAALGD